LLSSFFSKFTDIWLTFLTFRLISTQKFKISIHQCTQRISVFALLERSRALPPPYAAKLLQSIEEDSLNEIDKIKDRHRCCSEHCDRGSFVFSCLRNDPRRG